MGETTAYMGLATWDQLGDPYNYQQFANNWQIVAIHDHTPGHGVPIGPGGLAPGTVGITEINSTVGIVQTGMIVIWPASPIPSGYLACDGTPYLVANYEALFGVIGYTYGGSGTTFNAPALNIGPPTTTFTFVIKT